MTANTAYDVFLALSENEREKFLLLVDKTKIKIEYKKSKKNTKISREEAIDYLLKNIFSLKK